MTLAGALSACGGGGASSSSAAGGNEATMSEAAQLGQLIFRDTSLSASGRQACISCHDPDHGHAAPNTLAAQLGGADGGLQGGRSAPSLRYLASNRAFALAADGSPSGGFFWDGRAATLQAQAGGPFLNPVEMANASTAEMVTKLARSAYAARFAALYGADIFSRPDDAFARATLALQ
ncbi:MAG: cytochrome-c peroxidase, partial [Burkholderiales bacterium PBB5]